VKDTASINGDERLEWLALGTEKGNGSEHESPRRRTDYNVVENAIYWFTLFSRRQTISKDSSEEKLWLASSRGLRGTMLIDMTSARLKDDIFFPRRLFDYTRLP